LPSLYRLGYRPQLVITGLWRDPDVRRIVRLMAPATVGLAAVQVNVLINTYFASALGTGPNSYLNAAFRIFHRPIGLFGVAMATGTGARVSLDLARGDRGAFLDRVLEGSRAVAMVALPSTVGLIVLAEPVIALLFQHGRFHHAETLATVPVLQAYVLGV